MTGTNSLRERDAALRGKAIRVLHGLALLSLVMAGSGHAIANPQAENSERRIIVAIAEKPDPAPTSGSSMRGYAALPDYAGSQRTRATATRIADAHGLTEIAAWTIEPLQFRCMLYEVPASSSREEMLDRLRKDRRVKLAEPLREYSTLSNTLPKSAMPSAHSAESSGFNDPYIGLQNGFATIHAGQAQQWATGQRISVAVIDTAVDSSHPDLAGQVVEQRDFVEGDASKSVAERHGTEVAGVIAALANNELGIVGIAPAASIHAYRACWSSQTDGAAARCNTFTLAQALAAAIQSKAEVINLSLGGPRDPLLDQLLERALADGRIVVGAAPADPVADGFPTGIAGVIGVQSIKQSNAIPSADAVAAPGLDILTLTPGGRFDYGSGSSLAAAHVSGTIALILQMSPRLDGQRVLGLLRGSSAKPDNSINACAALSLLAKEGVSCGGESLPGEPDVHG